MRRIRDISPVVSGFRPGNYWRLTKNTETDIPRVYFFEDDNDDANDDDDDVPLASSSRRDQLSLVDSSLIYQLVEKFNGEMILLLNINYARPCQDNRYHV